MNFEEIRAGKFDEEAFNNDAFKNFNENALVHCEICDRTFLPAALERHLNACWKGIFKKWDE